jgi:PKD repeat protein
MKKALLIRLPFALLLAMILVGSCKKKALEVISGFSYTVDATNFKKVTFKNAAQNFSKLSWDFGDGTAAVTDADPVHTYAAIGTYSVKLTATGSDGATDVSTQSLTIADPDAFLTALVGDATKTWKLLRVVSPNRWPLEVGPITKAQVWWAMGRDNDEIALRSCQVNDEYTFGRDGSFKYDTKGDFWAEGGVFSPENICQTTSPANMKGPNGEDLSAFGDGTHTYVLTSGTKPTLEVKGLGAFIGLTKVATDSEVKLPQQSVKYNIIKLSDGAVDTLIIETNYKTNSTLTAPDAYWRFVLVHYDNAADEPAIPSPRPQPSFTGAINNLTVVFTNASKYSTSYSWDFGDGNTSSEVSPTHTYAAAGAYTVKLTAISSVASVVNSQDFTVTAGAMTEADLIGGAWKVRNAANSIFVGPALGSNAWWVAPANFLDGSSTGADDWSCITNDQFIFSAGGVYQYKTNGDARNDGYMGTPNGCWSDAQVAASGNGAAFGSGTHTFTFTPAASGGRPVITVNNGATGTAFVGFYKGYYGGENSDGTKLPNGGATSNRYEVMSYLKAGGVETLTISVDISAAHDGSSAWSMVLVR